MTTRPGTDHTPIRPLWLCRRCGLPWPCGEARLALLQRYDGDQLGLSHHLTGLYRQALSDLTRLNPHDGPTPADIFRRFLLWPAGKNPPACTG